MFTAYFKKCARTQTQNQRKTIASHAIAMRKSRPTPKTSLIRIVMYFICYTHEHASVAANDLCINRVSFDRYRFRFESKNINQKNVPKSDTAHESMNVMFRTMLKCKPYYNRIIYHRRMGLFHEFRCLFDD